MMTTNETERLAPDQKRSLEIAKEHGFTEEQWKLAKSIEMRIFGPYEWQNQEDRAASMFVAILSALREIERQAYEQAAATLDQRDEQIKRLREACSAIAGGYIPSSILNPALTAFAATGDKLAFKEMMVSWSQDTAREALTAKEPKS